MNKNRPKFLSFEASKLSGMLQEQVYEIRLPHFEGPFDLLLFFIERDELNIYDIPIARITDDFLAYIHRMQLLNLEMASEFIYVAATLMRIKVRMLLPRHEVDESGNEVDPRTDLVEKLIAYRKFKEVCNELRVLEHDRHLREPRGNISNELDVLSASLPYADELNQLTLYKLMSTFESVYKRFQNKAKPSSHTVFRYPFTVEGEKENLIEKLQSQDRINFTGVLKSCHDKVHVVYIFLAVLELLAEQKIHILIGHGYNNFWLSITRINNPAHEPS